ncbi:MAG: DUF1993 domain-containing protein [Burkholderiales bacterium]|nr:DUF1993 domain-containing protein [Burkholderiales bacterium]
MAISMYQASVPAFVRMLGNLSAIVDKAAAYAEARKIDQRVLLNARLFPDMLPFGKQVQIAADFAKGASARLAGIEVPKYDDNETNLAEFKARIQKTIVFLQTLKANQIDGSEDREIIIPIAGTPTPFKGLAYLIHFVLPNFYFHSATAYDILRHSGVELGKRDFIGSV